MERNRQSVGSGSPLEPEIGFSRAIRHGAHADAIVDEASPRT